MKRISGAVAKTAIIAMLAIAAAVPTWGQGGFPFPANQQQPGGQRGRQNQPPAGQTPFGFPGAAGGQQQPGFPGAAEGQQPGFPGAAGGQQQPGFPGAAEGQQPGAPGFNPFAQIPIKKFKVIAGKRVYCAISGNLLDDARSKMVPEAEAKKNYYDDGTHGDVDAEDGVYSNVEVVRDKFVSPEINQLRRVIQALIVHQEDRDPMDFYLLRTVSMDSLSDMANEMKIEEDRDEKVIDWSRKFLERYRVRPDDLRSPFYPVYVPAPPSLPDTPVPPGFNPTVKPGQTPEGESGGGAYRQGGDMDSPVFNEGEFEGSPSYQYFR